MRLSDYVPKWRDRYVADRGWTSTHDFPTGRLCLQAYSPYPLAQWTQQWRETRKRDLSARIPTIVGELVKATVDIARLVEEGERQVGISSFEDSGYKTGITSKSHIPRAYQALTIEPPPHSYG